MLSNPCTKHRVEDGPLRATVYSTQHWVITLQCLRPNKGVSLKHRAESKPQETTYQGASSAKIPAQSLSSDAGMGRAQDEPLAQQAHRPCKHRGPRLSRHQTNRQRLNDKTTKPPRLDVKTRRA
eukprot:TRINITY_DN4363_c0_g1_i2.p3 TRINITY_DN4363_c0_g1~~TRINITY_DN4363_c0_g1_i2.p3  ORF type:complete len:124 (-),score=0.07 TRINITY_DN4363_c0_g1_i2:396-767(-)